MKQDHAVDFRDFTPDSRRLDTFLGTYMQDHIQFAKSNALRLKVAHQSQEIPKLEKELKELKEKLKSLE